MHKSFFDYVMVQQQNRVRIVMRKLSVLCLVTVVAFSSCSADETGATEGTKTQIKAEGVEETVNPPAPEPTLGPPPTPEEVQNVFSVVSRLKAGFEKALNEKNLALFHETKENWNEEEKKINALTEKYGAEAIQKSPVGDCRKAFFYLFQTYVFSSGGITGALNAQEKRYYAEDKAKLSNLFNECEAAAKTGL